MERNIFAFLLCLAMSLILTVCVSCGGGGGATLHDSSENLLHRDGGTGGWGAGSSSGNNGGTGASNGFPDSSASERKLFSLFPYFNPPLSTIDISLSVNGAAPVVLTGLDSSTSQSVLPKTNIGDVISGNAVIHLADGSTRNAVCPRTEITIDNYLSFVTDFKCTLINTLTGVTLGTDVPFTTANGIDMSPYASSLVAPVALRAWKDTRTGAEYPATGIVYPRAGDAILETVWAAAVPVITYYDKNGDPEKTVTGSSETCRYSYLNYGDSVTVSGGGGMPVKIKSTNGKAVSGTVTPVTGGVSGTPEPFNETCGEYIRYLDPGTYEIFAQVAGGDSSTTTLDVGIRPVNVWIEKWEIYPRFEDEGGDDNIEIYGDMYFEASVSGSPGHVRSIDGDYEYHVTDTVLTNSASVTLTDIFDTVTVRTSGWKEDDGGVLNDDDSINNINVTLTLQNLRQNLTHQRDSGGDNPITHTIKFNFSE